MKNGGYINIQGWMINELKLKGNELVLYAIIYGFSQDGQSEYFGSQRYISKAMDISKTTANSLLNKLLDRGLIVKTQESHYKAVPETGTHNEKQGVPETGTGCTRNWYESVPETGTNNNTNNNYINNIDHFEEIWELYNFKKGKKKAKLKFDIIIKKQKEPLSLIEKIKKSIPEYLDHLKVETWKQQKQLEFWLNGEHWEDEYENKKAGKQSNIIHTQSDKYKNLKVTKA